MEKPAQELTKVLNSSTVKLTDLLEQTGRKDREAYAEFYHETAPRVYGLACRLLKNEAIAEEITQEVYLTVWQEATNYDSTKGSPLAWTLTLCHRKSVDRIRWEEANRKREKHYAFHETSTNEENELIARIDSEKITGLLENLSSKQNEVIELVYFQGKTIKEAAEVLTIPLPTAKTRLRDSLTKLRTLLGSDKNV